jgi:hypothetical protein
VTLRIGATDDGREAALHGRYRPIMPSPRDRPGRRCEDRPRPRTAAAVNRAKSTGAHFQP